VGPDSTVYLSSNTVLTRTCFDRLGIRLRQAQDEEQSWELDFMTFHRFKAKY
jgi:hypothetical protein